MFSVLASFAMRISNADNNVKSHINKLSFDGLIKQLNSAKVSSSSYFSHGRHIS
jgi:hypothetical protein